MKTAIWMHPWDLEGWEPAEMVRRLRALSVHACHLALAYHATRMLLPTHRSRRVYASGASAVYFGPGSEAASESRLVEPFLEACRRDGLPVRAWLVLCHQDGAGRETPERCVTNAYGDRVDYALCPSQPAVRAWCAARCAGAAALPGIEALDVEAAAFMGPDHQSAHDKRGVPLPPPIAWLLSLCFCPACRAALDPALADEIAGRARGTIDSYLARWTSWPALVSMEEALTIALGGDALRRLLAMRRRVLGTLIADIRAQVGPVPLLVRLAGSPWFTGGKTALPLEDLAGGSLGDAAVLTWLGADVESMRRELAALPARGARPVPIRGGFTLHAPDCRSREDVAARLDLLRDADVDEAIAYCYGLASEEHLSWLRAALQARQSA